MAEEKPSVVHTEDIISFLREKKVNEKYLSILTENEIDESCLESLDVADYEKMGIPKGPAVAIHKNCQALLTRIFQDRQKKRKKKAEEPRKFGWQVSSEFSYTHGAKLRGLEAGGNSLLERIQEFKELSQFEEEAFIKKLYRFALACINARQNGTIYFGIADDKKGQYQHGEVTGVSISSERLHVLYEALDTYLLGATPKHFRKDAVDKGMQALIKDCISTHIIPIKDSPDERFVVEIDIYPSYEICKTELAYVQNGQSRVAFFRQCTQSVLIPDSDWPKYEEKVRAQAEKRRKEELKNQQFSSGSHKELELKMKQLILQGQPRLMDKEYQYVLVTDSFDKQATEDRDFTWFGNVAWNFVIDLDPSETNFQSAKDGHEYLRLITLKEMKDALKVAGSNDGELIQRIAFGEKSPWIISRTEGCTSEEWFKQAKDTVTQTILRLTSGAAQEEKDCMVVLFLINSSQLAREISQIFIDFNGRLKPSQLVCLSSKEYVLQHLGDMLHCISKEEWKSIATCCESWGFLSSFIKGKLKHQVRSDHKISCSSGQSGIVISHDLVAQFKAKSDMEILLANHCAVVEPQKSKEDMKEEMAKVFEEFYRGAGATWELFYHSFEESSPLHGSLVYPAIVYRPRVKELVEDLESFRVSEQEVAVMQLIHHPDSGATTMAMHALWELRKDMRCVKVDGLTFGLNQQGPIERKNRISALANNLLIYRLYREEEVKDLSKIRPVLVLLDNASYGLTEQIKKELKQALIHKKQSSPGCKFIILACQQSRSSKKADLATRRQVGYDKLTHLQQQLDDVEKNIFALKMQELERVTEDCTFDTLLAFVIMANNFDSNSKYVVRFVEKAIEGIEKYRTDTKLLLYLSILKFYGYFEGTGLPTKHCKLLVSDKCSDQNAKRSIRSAVCSQVAVCLIEKEVHFGVKNKPFLFVEVSHAIVAKVLVDKLLPIVANDTTLSIAAMDMFKHKSFIQEEFLQREVHFTLRQLLIRRGYKDEEDGADLLDDEEQFQHLGGVPEEIKERFSKIISEISSKSSADALKLLKVAHDALRDDSKPFLSQAIARLYLDVEDFNQSLDWGIRAVTEAAGRKAFPFYDTLGQIYKKKMAAIIKSMKKHEYSIADDGLSKALDFAVEAEDHFQQAQNDYKHASLKEERLGIVDQRDPSLPAGDTPGIIGRIEIRLDIYKLLIQSQEFKGKEDSIKRLLQQPPDQQDIGQLRQTCSQYKQAFQAFEHKWKEKKEFIGSIYHETKRLLAAAAKKMTEVRMDILERAAKLFEKYFGIDVVQKLAEITVRRSQEQEMIRFLDPLYIRNFSWSIERNTSILETFAYMLSEIEHLQSGEHHERDESSMHQFRLCYVTCFLALFQRGSKLVYGINLEQATVYCEHMVSSMDSMIERQYQEWPEICNFYIILCMINSSSDWWSDDRREMLQYCLTHLHKQFKSHKVFRDKVVTYFQTESADNQTGQIRLSQHRALSHEHECWLSGRMDVLGNIIISICPGTTITLPKEHVHHQGRQPRRTLNRSNMQDVRFHLRFTQIGPVAKYVEKDQLVRMSSK